MYILGISGSPKKTGYTNLLFDEALDGAIAGGAKTDRIILNEIDFKACQECGRCDETGICVFGDDMKDIYAKLITCDALIIASPIYFGTITAQLKTMIDRCHSVWVSKYVLKNNAPTTKKRRGIFICTAGKDIDTYFENAKKVVKIFFATLGIEYKDDIFISGLDKFTYNSPKRKEPILRAYELGLSLTK